MKGSIAIGSRRTPSLSPVAAAVVSEPIVAARYVPCSQLNDWSTSGIVVERRPPKMSAEIGTPFGSWANRDSAGLFDIGAVKRLFGWAAFSFDPLVQGSPFQSIISAGGSVSFPSHHTSPSFVRATFVKNVSRSIDFIAFGFVFVFVPGTTPK